MWLGGKCVAWLRATGNSCVNAVRAGERDDWWRQWAGVTWLLLVRCSETLSLISACHAAWCDLGGTCMGLRVSVVQECRIYERVRREHLPRLCDKSACKGAPLKVPAHSQRGLENSRRSGLDLWWTTYLKTIRHEVHLSGDGVLRKRAPAKMETWGDLKPEKSHRNVLYRH